jgi:hypothetical protein
MVNLTELQGNLNEAELEALKKTRKEKKLQLEFDRRVEQGKIIVKNGNYQLNPSKEVKEFVDAGKAKFKSELAKGGEVKKYMGGGSVRKNKNKMITTRGWGASRKT